MKIRQIALAFAFLFDSVAIAADSVKSPSIEYGSAPGVLISRARGHDKGRDALLSGDVLNGIYGRGYDGSSFTTTDRVAIELQASENWTQSANGTAIVFKTTPAGSTTPVTSFAVEPGGLELSGSGASESGVIDRILDLSYTGLIVPTNAVFFGEYVSVTSADTTDHTGDAAHFGAAVFRSQDVAGGRTDSITLESRNDARTTQASVESTSMLAYMDAVGAGTMSGDYYTLRVRPCISTDGDCATDNATGNLFGLAIENLQGGDSDSRAILQLGTDDFNVFLASSTVFGSNTSSMLAKVGIVQSGGADVKAALSILSGGAGLYTYQGIGRASVDYYLGVSADNDQFLTGNVAGDAFIATGSTSNRLGFSSGLNATPELAISDGRTTLVGAMRITPQASAPGSPAAGDIYVDSTAAADELCFYDGAAWQGISSGTDANCS